MSWLQSLAQMITIIILSRLNEEILALRDVRVKMPHVIRRGQQKVLLKCLYDIEDDILYAVKWYKGRREFYRYTPSEEPPMKIFQIPGVRIDRLASNETDLVLEAATMATAGKYSCEVSADAPSFHTLIAAAELHVVELPHNPPFIAGIQQRYHIGDILRGNCTIRHSKPPANLTWTVNDDEVQHMYVHHMKVHKEGRNGDIQMIALGIHFILTSEHFNLYGILKLRCIAQIGDIYYKFTEKIIHLADNHYRHQHQHQHQYHHNQYDIYQNNHKNYDDNDYHSTNNIDMMAMANGYNQNDYSNHHYIYRGHKASNYITQVQELSARSEVVSIYNFLRPFFNTFVYITFTYIFLY